MATQCPLSETELLFVSLPQEEEVDAGTQFFIYHTYGSSLTVSLNGEVLKASNDRVPRFTLPSDLTSGTHKLELSLTPDVDQGTNGPLTSTHTFIVGTPESEDAPPPVITGINPRSPTVVDLCTRIYKEHQVFCPEVPNDFYDVDISGRVEGWSYALEKIEDDKVTRRIAWPEPCSPIVDLGYDFQNGCFRAVALGPKDEVEGPTVCDLKNPMPLHEMNEQPMDHEVPEQVDEEEPGCTVSSHSPGRPSPWSILLVVLALPWVRRFRPQR